MRSWPYRLFEVTGIEIEYMIVDRDTLDARSIADRLIEDEHGSIQAEIERDDIAWSNELALHVIELKTNGPASSLATLPMSFSREVGAINEHLERRGARLMPGAMHPWFDPRAEFRLWPHEYSLVFHAFDRIFDCTGHGWANLQSCHINLPFGTDEEFGRLHAAIRLVLPILPAIAASSPFADGVRTPWRDTRLEVYRHNAARVPSVAGHVIPEPIFHRAAYEREILDRIYEDLEPHDPEGILRREWVNARGCIPRFDRGSIEIRLLDTQEHPGVDLAIASAVIAIVRRLVEEQDCSHEDQKGWSTDRLTGILLSTIRDGENAAVEDVDYRTVLGAPRAPGSAGALWSLLIDRSIGTGSIGEEIAGPLEVILREGTLSTRLVGAAGESPGRDRLRRVYERLCGCLDEGESFRAS